MANGETNRKESVEAFFDAFPRLRSIQHPEWQSVMDALRFARVPAGAAVFTEGDPCQNYILCVDGRARVYKNFPSGRQITLYRVERGQACSLTTACLLANKPYPANGSTDSEVHAAMLPADKFRSAMGRIPEFRAFVYSGYGDQLAGLINLVKTITFDPIDVRLAQYLLDHTHQDGAVTKTHQDIAFELGTVREVVSRELTNFRKRGWVTSGRREIEVRDREALNALILSRVV